MSTQPKPALNVKPKLAHLLSRPLIHQVKLIVIDLEEGDQRRGGSGVVQRCDDEKVVQEEQEGFRE